MPCLPSASISSTLRPACASASASAAATVVLPVPPLPVTTCSCTPSQSVSLAVMHDPLSLLHPCRVPAGGGSFRRRAAPRAYGSVPGKTTALLLRLSPPAD